LFCFCFSKFTNRSSFSNPTFPKLSPFAISANQLQPEQTKEAMLQTKQKQNKTTTKLMPTFNNKNKQQQNNTKQSNTKTT
jgi:hypothetical protein